MRAFLHCCLFLGAAAMATAAEDLAIGPGTLLADPAHDPAWTELFSRLAASKTRQSQFEERRFFPFRTTPVILKGEIRIAPGRGLSLRYLEPDQRILIVDAKGLLMRDDEGHDRAAPSDSRAQAVTAALVSVLQFDLPALQKSFVMYGRHEGNSWMLGFVPRDPALANMIGTLLVSGEQTRLDRIEMTKSAKQRIEILVSGTREDVIFPGDVIGRFFR